MYIFIVNPVSGSGRAKKIYNRIANSKPFSQVDTHCFFTQYGGHAEIIAKQLTDFQEPVTCVIVIAGDGTLHEVINGLNVAKLPVASIPAGSGNDFARGCGISGSPVDMFNRIINRIEGKPYWLGYFRTDHHQGRYFVNNIGIGFDAEIAKTVNQSRYKQKLNKLRLGKISYIMALLQVLFRFKPMDLEIIADGQQRKLKDCWMVTITNHPYFGGGMKIIPDAVIQPERFPVLIIHSISKWKVLGLFITVFSGKHTQFKEVELFQAEHLEIYPHKPVTYQTDGQTDDCPVCMITKEKQHIKIMGI
ncbi:diacylglycerol kinase family protein [Lentibacillus sp. CBA3610]|uniref:diacylglycerol/lipid kinase family protein n=1 Tax=Lentibacillus sp. CBA3610 TaxID=2518176 RepID=UPI001595E33C|nr:diacylglycerol kinase family protein [Lentibacillus sp. CBA3610]QKY69738.1 diacylglycerol kinase family lipid kinase [Lentibacillus sp. CBA3610]